MEKRSASCREAGRISHTGSSSRFRAPTLRMLYQRNPLISLALWQTRGRATIESVTCSQSPCSLIGKRPNATDQVRSVNVRWRPVEGKRWHCPGELGFFQALAAPPALTPLQDANLHLVGLQDRGYATQSVHEMKRGCHAFRTRRAPRTCLFEIRYRLPAPS